MWLENTAIELKELKNITFPSHREKNILVFFHLSSKTWLKKKISVAPKRKKKRKFPSFSPPKKKIRGFYFTCPEKKVNEKYINGAEK